MKKNPIPVRFGVNEDEIKEAARTCGISVQDAIRLAVGFGLPHLLHQLKKIPEVSFKEEVYLEEENNDHKRINGRNRIAQVNDYEIRR